MECESGDRKTVIDYLDSMSDSKNTILVKEEFPTQLQDLVEPSQPLQTNQGIVASVPMLQSINCYQQAQLKFLGGKFLLAQNSLRVNSPIISSPNIFYQGKAIPQVAALPQGVPSYLSTNESTFTDSATVKAEPPTLNEDPLLLEYDDLLRDSTGSRDVKSLPVADPLKLAHRSEADSCKKLPDDFSDSGLTQGCCFQPNQRQLVNSVASLPLHIPHFLDQPEFDQTSPLKEGRVEVAAASASGRVSFERAIQDTFRAVSSQKFKCSICSESFHHETDLSKHIPKHFECGSGPQHRRYYCSICSSSFRRPSGLKTHMDHHNNIKKFKCAQCEYETTYSHDLKVHMMHRHSKSRPHSCNVCNKEFKRRSNLACHMELHSGYKPFKCDSCPESFSSISKLKLHSVNHQTLRPFGCSVCDANFKRKGDLRQHMESHLNIKPYKCPDCPLSFRRKEHLKAHSISHLDEASLKELEELLAYHLSETDDEKT